MAKEELLNPLINTEDASEEDATTSLALDGESPPKEEEGEDERVSGTCLEKRSLVGQHVQPETANDGQNRAEGGKPEVVVMRTNAETKPIELDLRRLNLSDGATGDEPQWLNPEFPEALYELLCTLQEGRRLNDQRCSFRLEGAVGRRRCHSEPNTNKPAHRVHFSSMTSLQKEEFFELVATAQARRLDDQRARLQSSSPPPAAPKAKSRSFRGSIKQISFVRKPPVPAPVPKQDLYDMILTTQAQGRLEEQRSRAPGPMDDEDFFSLLLRVQGGRMEEQRTELPLMLET